MSTIINASRGSAARRGPKRLLLASLLVVGVSPFVASVGLRAGYWPLFFGPPLDFDRPHDGQVVAHIDVLGETPPDIARIRISEVSTGATVWDVKPTTAKSECWNGCWNLTFKAGSNPSSFTAGHQQFTSSVPQEPSYSLTPGTVYLFEVWDSRGRVKQNRFTL